MQNLMAEFKEVFVSEDELKQAMEIFGQSYGSMNGNPFLSAVLDEVKNSIIECTMLNSYIQLLCELDVTFTDKKLGELKFKLKLARNTLRQGLEALSPSQTVLK